MTLLAWFVAGFLDRLLGDPPHWPHPIRWIGALITLTQRAVRRVCLSDTALRIGWRDRYNHSSPNCAWPEATVAGALGVRLGGPNDYFGQRVEKPWIGDDKRAIHVDDITQTIRLMWTASTLALALFAIVHVSLAGAAI